MLSSSIPVTFNNGMDGVAYFNKCFLHPAHTVIGKLFVFSHVVDAAETGGTTL